MSLLLLSALLAGAPVNAKPLTVQEQIQLELQTRIRAAEAPCHELEPAASPGGDSIQPGFQVSPTGKVKVAERPPKDPFLALVFRCRVAALGELSVKVRGVTQQLDYDWPVNVARSVEPGLAWFADEPARLDRVTLLAGPKQTWFRCEHKDASLVHHAATKSLARWSALAVVPAASTSEVTDSSPFWRLDVLQDGKATRTARRGDLPKFAAALETASGLKSLCEPVRALGDKLPKVFESKQGTLAACLKHRHNDLWLTLTLSGSGAVTAADASATSGLDDAAIACLQKTALRWSFPYKGQPGATVSGHLSAAPPGE